MKHLAYLSYSVTNAMFVYLKDKNLEDLIKDLRRIEKIHQNEIENHKGELWFKFGKDDTLVTTISDIENDLSLPYNHSNHQLMLIHFNIVTKDIEPDNEIRIYYS